MLVGFAVILTLFLFVCLLLFKNMLLVQTFYGILVVHLFLFLLLNHVAVKYES